MNVPSRDFFPDGIDAVDWHPGKLWSLWDIMKPFDADAALFMKFMEAAGMTRTLESSPLKIEMRLID